MGTAPPPPSPSLSPQKLIVEKLLEEDAFRKELARVAEARGHRKQPLGSRREPGPPAPPGHGAGAGGWPGGVAALLGEEPPEEPGGQSEAPEELAVGAEVAVPKFEGRRWGASSRGGCRGGIGWVGGLGGSCGVLGPL